MVELVQWIVVENDVVVRVLAKVVVKVVGKWLPETC